MFKLEFKFKFMFKFKFKLKFKFMLNLCPIPPYHLMYILLSHPNEGSPFACSLVSLEGQLDLDAGFP